MPKKNNSSRIKSHDYQAWDKYNAEEEAAKVDTKSKDKATGSTKTKVSAQLSDKGDVLFNFLFSHHVDLCLSDSHLRIEHACSSERKIVCE